MKLKFLVLSFLSIIILVLACKYEPIEIPDNNGNNHGNNNGNGNGNTTLKPCSPDSVYFQNDVLPILVSNCAKAGCHDAISKKDGIQTTDYNSVMKKIIPFNLTNSKIYESITEKDKNDIMPPLPSAPLTNVQIETIGKWILQGAKNNSCDSNTSGCDTKNVKFSSFVQPLMNKYCTGCHGKVSPSAAINLTDYTNIVAYAKNGSLYGSMAHSGGYSSMPKGGKKIDQCDLDKLNAWIKEGSQNN